MSKITEGQKVAFKYFQWVLLFFLMFGSLTNLSSKKKTLFFPNIYFFFFLVSYEFGATGCKLPCLAFHKLPKF